MPKRKPAPPQAFAENKQARYAARESLRAREIGELRPVKNPERRERLKNDLAGWLRAYMPHSFTRAFSGDQLEAVRRLQQSMTTGGTFAVALPRGSGKTTIAEGAVLWAALNGWRFFLVILGADQRAADSIIRDIKTELETNSELASDFPEVIQAVEHLEGRPQKCSSQTWEGDLTRMVWKSDKIVFPIRAGSSVSGTVILARGITGGVRGLKHKTGDRDIRPDFVLPDDPQTRESANSATQTEERRKIILGDVLGLAGHDRKIAVMMTCTVIVKGDLSSQFLDASKHPEWQGVKGRLVNSFGTAEKLWEEYGDLWRDGQAAGEGCQRATDFYLASRAAMDAGWDVGYPDMYDRATEASAIQHAYNLLLSVGEFAFRAEYQNDPLEDSRSQYEIDPDIVCSRTVDLPQFHIPADMPSLVAFTDINNRGLHWVAAGFKDGLTGHVCSYGRNPERGELVPENASNTDRNKLIFAGLARLVEMLETFRFVRGGQPAKLDALHIDAGTATDTVYQFCASTRASFKLLPSRGYSCSKYFPLPSRTIGQPREQCHMADGQTANYIAHNACYWREIAQRAFASDPGSPGSISLFGGKPILHRAFAEHICNEKLTDKAVGDKGTMYKWQKLPGWNDWLDALVGCLTAAAFGGLTTTGKTVMINKRRRPVRVAGNG